MKIMEMIFVIIIFFFLFVMSIIFYAKISSVNTKMSSTQLFKDKLDVVTSKIQSFPELQCSLEGIPREHCIDALKLQAFIDSMSDNKRKIYSIMFSDSQIEVIQTYPEEKEWIVFSDKSGNTNAEGAGALVSLMPTSIYYPMDGHYAFGYIKTTVFRYH